MVQQTPLDLSIVMISLNEAHHLRAVLENLKGWCQKIYLVDSLSSDETVNIALEYGVEVVQRPFTGFGDQWNFALNHFHFSTNWIMKLDPDERLSSELKSSISYSIENSPSEVCGFTIQRRLNFMEKPLPIRQPIDRIWRKGKGRFSDVRVNEHLEINGKTLAILGDLEHLDSPNLHHWYAKQNKYFTTEAIMQFKGEALASEGNLFGSSKDRRMSLKRIFWSIPGRYSILHLYHLFGTGAWKAGREGRIWAKIRTEIYRSQEFKLYEMRKLGRPLPPTVEGKGAPHPNVPFIQN